MLSCCFLSSIVNWGFWDTFFFLKPQKKPPKTQKTHRKKVKPLKSTSKFKRQGKIDHQTRKVFSFLKKQPNLILVYFLKKQVKMHPEI